MGRRKSSNTAPATMNSSNNFEGTKIRFQDADDEEIVSGSSNLDDSVVTVDKGSEDVSMGEPDVSFFGCEGDDDKTSADYYFDSYSHFEKQALMEPLVDTVDQKQIVTNCHLLRTMDISKMTPGDASFTAPFKLIAGRDDYIHAFAAYFDVSFTRCHKLMGFSTVTRPDGSYDVPGRGYKEYGLDGYSSWLRELEQGCCKPPTICGYTFVNPTMWTNPTSPIGDPDCNLWSNDQTQLCCNCNSCRAGLLGNLRSEWRKANIILIVAVVVLICVYVIGCSALKYAQTEELFRRYKQVWI
ncbi:Tetraspanin-2 [Hibiscus syriacus]|uniref:Tetraspanin-2 n=1 Tax=Hibiscus syriacus TaxID=106335 RepID=A0A6A3C6U9_HIBSY|nr:Tetraspanin-2 [Hibiscus syriacus]